MSLLTLERSSPSPHESDVEDILSCSSYEGFVAREHYAMCLSPRPLTSLGRHGEQLRIFAHLKKLVRLLRPSDSLKLAVELENTIPRNVTKYVILITTIGHQDTEETLVLGTEQEGSMIRLCLVLPLWRDTEIKLDGDGGFSVHTGDRHQVFKPSSVQSMWKALQALYKATEQARKYNYYVGGVSHTWIQYYQTVLTDDWAILTEWNMMEDVESFRPDSPIYSSDIGNAWNEDRQSFEKLLVHKLREVMLHKDLEEVTSKQLRLQLEREMEMDLKEYRGYLDQQMLRILGQMERPSAILDYLYLGSEWNASNLVELKELGITYILNVTREIDNFYPEVFKYLNIRLFDVPESELLKHWEKTYKFIKEAKLKGCKVLVHCRMGISRSAATTTAYIMKEYKMSLKEALESVKKKRSVINPNEGFMNQLKAYEGILKARHNTLWGVQAPSRQIFHMKRSVSDPTIQQSLLEEGLEVPQPELAFLVEEGTMDDLCMLPRSPKSPHPHNHYRHNYHVGGMVPTMSTPVLPFDQSTPVDKSESIRSFLASLPCIHQSDDDQGIGIGENVCTSDSGSGYSSPILTPPDEEQIHHLYRFAKEIHEESRQRLMSDDLESKDSISPPPMEDRPNGDSATPEKQTLVQSALPRVSPKPTPFEQRGREPVQSKISPSPPYISTEPSDRPHPVAAPDYPTSSHLPVKPSRSVSLPHNIPYPAYPVKGTSISPNSSRTSLSSLVQNPQEVSNSRAGSAAESRPPLLREENVYSPSSIEDRTPPSGADVDSRSESPFEPLKSPLERLNLHRRVKSDSCDISGPVKTAQIHSVPERVKEIEELNAQVTKSQPTSQSQTLERPVEFFLSSNGSSPKPDATQPSSVGSMSRTSSEESLPCQPLSQILPHGEEEDDGEIRSSVKPTSSPWITSTRHTSLSPKPKSHVPHLPLQSSLSLPSNIPPPELDPTLNGQDAQSMSDEDIASSLQGAVRAIVQDIEERNKDEVSITGTAVATSKSRKNSQRSEVPVKPTSPLNDRRPSTDAAAQRPHSMVIESNRIPTFEPLPPRASYLKQRRPSSDVIMLGSTGMMESFSRSRERTPPSSSSSLRPIANTSKFMSVEDLSSKASQLASVKELKRKFEDTDMDAAKTASSKLRRGVSIRRSQSLRGISNVRVKIRPRLPRLVSASQLGQTESVQCSPPRQEYITTIPSFKNDTAELEDFETTRSKFATAASSAQ